MAETVTALGGLMIPLQTAVTLLWPAAMPVTTPVPLTDAIAGVVLVHVAGTQALLEPSE